MTDRWDRWVRRITFANALTVAVVLLLLYGWLVREAAPVVAAPPSEAQVRRLLGPVSTPEGSAYVWQPISAVPKYSVVPLLMGTAKVSALATAVAAGLGLPAALFTASFARGRLAEGLRTWISLAGGVPAVVVGAVVLLDVAPPAARLLKLGSPLSALTAGIALGFWAAPTVYGAGEEALRRATRAQLEAGLALGATRWQVLRDMVIPAARPGLVAAVLLGAAQILGETMIVLMVSGNAAVATWDMRASTRTISATLAAEMGEVVAGSVHYRILFLLGTLLLLATSILNAAARLLQARAGRTLEQAAGGPEGRPS
ncbi:PstC family ABC transporter permease [Caldinitratiruptor microaerophilus]|uniref:ABC transmembrane type-1 domain-containing protein n=1 Tax=Caldinitratiruptor microaerophilus TaxID=671077 RepID=A0AA35CK59_9FIRM|nr:ABC transporter permease subunit [Caldinitratiruptor microaerophilus]BDG60707.1 hypothetical protein caldi_17970 [Caldinitratiruptor microaerophilus]